jgi:tetratricopeptide (TPR) repeat protein
VARSVVAALQITLSPQAAGIESRQSANVEAYEHWLRGSHFVRLYLISNKEQDIQSAIHHYEAAVSIDPAYALAYGGMAWANEHHYVFSGRKNRTDRDQAVRCILKGYQLDSLSGSLNAGMGYLACLSDDYDMAYHFYTTALALEPRSLVVNHLAGEFLSSIGLIRQSERFYEAAIALDPYYLFSNGEAADAMECEAEWEKAAAYYQRVMLLSPNDRLYRAQYIVLLLKMGRVKEAADLLTEAMKNNPDFVGYIRCRALIHAAHGERKQALKLRQDPEVYALLGMKADALRLLEERAGKEDHYQYIPLTSNPFFSGLHGDPRFQAILSRLEREYQERIRKYADLGSKTIGRR